MSAQSRFQDLCESVPLPNSASHQPKCGFQSSQPTGAHSRVRHCMCRTSPTSSFSEDRLIFKKLEVEMLKEDPLVQTLSGSFHPRDSLCYSATQACCPCLGLGTYAAVWFPSSGSVHIYCGKGHEKATFSLSKARSNSTLGPPCFLMEILLVVSFQGFRQDLSWASSPTPCWLCILELLAEGECIASGDQPTETTQGTAASENIVSSADSS